METTTANPVLPEPLPGGFAQRCRGYDIENRFFDEDFRDLKQAGYLTIAVPREFGGRGLNLARTCREQRRLGFVLGVFAWALLGFANIYHGLAQRAIDLVVSALKSKTAVALSRSMADHPEVQHAVAQMTLALDPVGPHLDRIAEDWSAGVDHGGWWPAKIVSAKYRAVEACWRIVDLAMDVSGGTGMFKQNELERLFRDARCGRFHPANSLLTHEIVGKTALGIDLGEQPRWG